LIIINKFYKVEKENHQQNLQNTKIKVESITFYRFFKYFFSFTFILFRPDKNGNPDQEVDGVFFTIGVFCFLLSIIICRCENTYSLRIVSYDCLTLLIILTIMILLF
jgi:hypothetical protein